MPFPAPVLQPKPLYVPPAIVRIIPREDVLWNRPIFKAPPLIVRVAAGGPLPAESDPSPLDLSDPD